MELHLKQWREQHESEQQASAKIPKLFLEPHQPQPQPQPQPQQQQQRQQPSGSSAIPLFVPDPTSSKVSSLSAFPDSTTRFTKMGSYFSLAQWQELELQALIYRYMLAGAAVPPELLQPIKKSLHHSSPYFLHHPLQYYPHYQPALLQSGYWGKSAMDPESGRCRRTDGKKWRCSRDVVAGHKYCERHMHRGRNRSRKHVEIPTPTSTPASSILGRGSGGGLSAAAGTHKNSSSIDTASPLAEMANGPSFGLSGPSPSIDLLHFNRRSSVSKTGNEGLLEPHKYNEADNRSDGRVLRHFFDDWPRSLQETNNADTNANMVNSAICLSISMPGNSSSDVSLKLSTGNGEELGTRLGGGREEPQLNWATGWATNPVASMGGPLAEALRSSISNSSPTSVLQQLTRSSASETSYVST